MCFCRIAFYSSVCGSLGCCWFTVLCDVSLESLLREGEMFLKTFIINQRNHLRGTPFLYLKFNSLSSLQPLPGVLYMCLFCHLIQWTDRFSVLSSSTALCHHLFTTATGEDEKDRRQELIIYFFHLFERKCSGEVTSQECPSSESQGRKNWEFEKEMVHRTDLVGGFLWVDRSFKFLTDSGKPWRCVYKSWSLVSYEMHT